MNFSVINVFTAGFCAAFVVVHATKKDWTSAAFCAALCTINILVTLK